jgi:alpha-D-xyloside xylohydrolase
MKAGDIEIIILVKDGSAIPHVPVAQSTDKIDWNKITWKKYSVDTPAKEGLLYLPQDETREK